MGSLIRKCTWGQGIFEWAQSSQLMDNGSYLPARSESFLRRMRNRSCVHADASLRMREKLENLTMLIIIWLHGVDTVMFSWRPREKTVNEWWDRWINVEDIKDEHIPAMG